MHRFVHVLLALALLASCQPATVDLTEEQKAEIAAEVEARLNHLWEVLRDPDFDQMMTFFHQSPELLSVHDGGYLEGYATAENLRPSIDEWEDQVITVSEARTLVLSSDVVYTMRVGTDSITYKSGEAVPTRPWVATHLWVRSNGEWKILAGHGSHPSPLNP